MKPYSMKIIMFLIVKGMGRCITSLVVSTFFTYLALENSSIKASKQGLRQADRNCPSLHRIKREVRVRCFIIIALSYDSCLKVSFIRHSGFVDSDPPRVCSEYAATRCQEKRRESQI